MRSSMICCPSSIRSGDLAYLVRQKKTFREMSVKTGIKGIVTSLRPGTEKCWKEKGLL